MSFNPDFEPAAFVPFRDRREVARVNALVGPDYLTHENPDVRIEVVPDGGLGPRMVDDMVREIVTARDEGRRCVLLLPNPNPAYRDVARILNRERVDLAHVTTFALDEWADHDGNVADERYPQSFAAAFRRFFWDELDDDLRMPAHQVVAPTTENIGHYSELLHAAGDADVSYTGPGWTGHLAFVDPLTPEFSGDLEEFMSQGARIVTLNPLTVAQNSLHGSFGASGDIANVPPRAATVGPLDIARARRRVELHGITTRGTFATWQRTISRLTLHGPVTPLVPASIIQRLGAEVWVTESLAAPVQPDFDEQY